MATVTWVSVSGNAIGYWVVTYNERPGYWVVDCSGFCGEEPVRAGPYDTAAQAEAVAVLLSRVDPMDYPSAA